VIESAILTWVYLRLETTSFLKALGFPRYMKKPKTVKRHCPYCKKHTEHKVTIAKAKTRGTARPLSRGSAKRMGTGKGMGNLGIRGSKPALSKWKMTGKKLSKKTDFRYECKECKKTHAQKSGKRAKKVEMV
jgi:large subunit ribosomal protein L44e